MLNTKHIFPKQGDFIWIDAEPHKGKEYGGHNAKKGNIRRPAVVISHEFYNKATGMVVVFPITSKDMSDRLNFIKVVSHSTNGGINGWIVMGNLLGYDYFARNGEIVGAADSLTKRKLKLAVKNIFDF
ncbi:MAG: type II toxin-antitoxin system PemK/MazF family toxin [Lactobacillales bacterium]|jgi:mRNA interferase MazF|nr:type II toxin-antitoxin system PemK/MazF family toxin [Lactobacillales bacterium]